MIMDRMGSSLLPLHWCFVKLMQRTSTPQGAGNENLFPLGTSALSGTAWPLTEVHFHGCVWVLPAATYTFFMPGCISSVKEYIVNFNKQEKQKISKAFTQVCYVLRVINDLIGSGDGVVALEGQASLTGS